MRKCMIFKPKFVITIKNIYIYIYIHIYTYIYIRDRHEDSKEKHVYCKMREQLEIKDGRVCSTCFIRENENGNSRVPVLNTVIQQRYDY